MELNLLRSGMKENVWTMCPMVSENITTPKMDSSGTMVISHMAVLMVLEKLQMLLRPMEYSYFMKESGETVSNMA
jgi:hypothetical protein